MGTDRIERKCFRDKEGTILREFAVVEDQHELGSVLEALDGMGYTTRLGLNCYARTRFRD